MMSCSLKWSYLEKNWSYLTKVELTRQKMYLTRQITTLLDKICHYSKVWSLLDKTRWKLCLLGTIFSYSEVSDIAYSIKLIQTAYSINWFLLGSFWNLLLGKNSFWPYSTKTLSLLDKTMLTRQNVNSGLLTQQTSSVLDKIHL